MKRCSIFLLLLLFANVFGQKKVLYSSEGSLLNEMQPAKNITSWMLISCEYGKNTVVRSSGNQLNYDSQDSGFQFSKNENQYYFIVYDEGGKTMYVRDLASLKFLLGTIDNPAEAALLGISEGYFFDSEFKELAGNYINDKNNYIVELAKVTSTSCPLSKNHYELTIDKKTGKIISAIDNGVYNEIYDKTCKNNPHHAEIQVQIEEAKVKQLEKDKEAKIMRDKMKKKQAKTHKRY